MLRIQALAVGERLLVPVGWVGEPGHSLNLMVERATEAAFHLKLYNLGPGLEYHIGIMRDGVFYYQTYIEVRGVPAEALLSAAFAKALIEMQEEPYRPMPPKAKQGNPLISDYCAKDLYSLLLTGLGGEVVASNGRDESLMRVQ